MPALLLESEEWRATCVEALKLMEANPNMETVTQLEDIAKLTGLESINDAKRVVIDRVLEPTQKKLLEVHRVRAAYQGKLRVLKHYRSRKRDFQTIRIEHVRPTALSEPGTWTFFGSTSTSAPRSAPQPAHHARPIPRDGFRSSSFKGKAPSTKGKMSSGLIPQTWSSIALGGAISGAASFFITFLMRYYKHSVANITDKDARARAEAMYNAVEWVVGGVSIGIVVGSIVVIFMTGGAAAIPILIGFLGSFLGSTAANFLCDMIFRPEVVNEGDNIDNERHAPGEIPPGFIHTGSCLCCAEHTATVAMIHPAQGRPNEGVAHFSYCAECYNRHQARIDASERCACCNTPITDIAVYEQNEAEVLARGGPFKGYIYTGTCTLCPNNIDFTHRANDKWNFSFCQTHGPGICNGARLVHSSGLED